MGSCPWAAGLGRAGSGRGAFRASHCKSVPGGRGGAQLPTGEFCWPRARAQLRSRRCRCRGLGCVFRWPDSLGEEGTGKTGLLGAAHSSDSDSWAGLDSARPWLRQPRLRKEQSNWHPQEFQRGSSKRKRCVGGTSKAHRRSPWCSGAQSPGWSSKRRGVWRENVRHGSPPGQLKQHLPRRAWRGSPVRICLLTPEIAKWLLSLQGPRIWLYQLLQALGSAHPVPSMVRALEGGLWPPALQLYPVSPKLHTAGHPHQPLACARARACLHLHPVWHEFCVPVDAHHLLPHALWQEALQVYRVREALLLPVHAGGAPAHAHEREALPVRAMRQLFWPPVHAGGALAHTHGREALPVLAV
ncbi:uncharacterized protein LOC128598525 isoform X2 [Nycticebus coucang]|uniref:uncharacterized protein LOC128598525 isoform X2 n=1 Tax=Nycticebus coucang TaxID=9470 RepID=UPI00234C41FB|nr:uncharacterized protein LOC128598525 isoform X2 [Nycticebus coucang]